MKQRNLNTLAVQALGRLQEDRATENAGTAPDLRVVVDGSYTNKNMLRHLPVNTTLIGNPALLAVVPLWRQKGKLSTRFAIRFSDRPWAARGSGGRGYGMADGVMVLTTYGRSSGFCIDPIEKNRSTISILDPASSRLARPAAIWPAGSARIGISQNRATRTACWTGPRRKASPWRVDFIGGLG